jgi:hypothetical protein
MSISGACIPTITIPADPVSDRACLRRSIYSCWTYLVFGLPCANLLELSESQPNSASSLLQPSLSTFPSLSNQSDIYIIEEPESFDNSRGNIANW